MEEDMFVFKIWRALPQVKSHRQMDEAESRHQHLVRCVSKAEKLTQRTGVQTRVIGWYYSQPKNTSPLSHIDLKFQAQHQSLDNGFVELIVSFLYHNQELKCTAYQITNPCPNRVRTATEESCKEQFNDEEIMEEFTLSLDGKSLMFNGIEIVLCEDCKMTEAIVAKAELTYKEIRIEVVPPRIIFEYSLMDVAQLHDVLITEESEAYQRVVDSQTNVSKLTQLQQGSRYIQGMIDLINGALIPNLNSLLAMKQQNKLNIEQLDKEIEQYKAAALESPKIKSSNTATAVIERKLEPEVSLTGSAVDTLYDLIDYSTLDLDLFPKSKPFSYHVETTHYKNKDEVQLSHEKVEAESELKTHPSQTKCSENGGNHSTNTQKEKRGTMEAQLNLLLPGTPKQKGIGGESQERTITIPRMNEAYGSWKGFRDNNVRKH
eukprot:g3701.t1